MSNIVKQPHLLKKIQSVAMNDIKVEPTKHVELRLSESMVAAIIICSRGHEAPATLGRMGAERVLLVRIQAFTARNGMPTNTSPRPVLAYRRITTERLPK